MRTRFCDDVGIEAPIFAFTHCRDVVVAVSKAGGLGVLGAGFMDVEQLREELDWIDAHIGDRPYGVDVVIPQNYAGREEDGLTEQELEEKLWAMVPSEHLPCRAAARRAWRSRWPETGRPKIFGWTRQTVMPCLRKPSQDANAGSSPTPWYPAS